MPDVFINGVVERIKGSSSVDNAIERLERVMLPLMKENSHFTIEPEIKYNGEKISVSVKLARLGSVSIENIFIRAVLVKSKVANMFTLTTHLVSTWRGWF